MLKKLKIYSAKKPLNVFLKNNRARSVKNLDKIGMILDLDVMEKDFDLSDLRKELDFPYEHFDSIVCTKEKTIAEKYSLEQFDEDNLGWKATFNVGSKEKSFQETNYALLLNYFVNPSPELLILSASVNANFKVGFPVEEKRLNDMDIDVDPKNYRLFAEELKKYLKVIKQP